jgi:glc operon protein GlcG
VPFVPFVANLFVESGRTCHTSRNSDRRTYAGEILSFINVCLCTGIRNIDHSRSEVATAALAEARKNNFTMAIAVVDTAGNLVYFEKMDGTQTGSVNVSIEKARSAVLFKRPTKSFQDTVAQGGVGLRMLGLPGAVPVEGGIPLMEGGKIVGAVGASGGTSDQDGQCAQAGANTMK